MPLETIPFEGAEYLDTAQAEMDVLADATATGDAGYIRHALNTVARARGMTAIANEAGISRRALFETYRSSDKARTEALLATFRALSSTPPEKAVSAAE